jgi:hypothetical protein
MSEEYGYTKEFRSQVLRDADTYGVMGAAAKHGVGKSSIYRWMQERERIEEDSWIDICARHITIEKVVFVLCGFVAIIAMAHAIEFFLSR